MSTLLEIRGLRAGYGKVPVLHGVDLDVQSGEILGVLGHNGMGKSTLLKTLMGIIPATGGSMKYDGHDLTKLRSSERAQFGIGYVPQGRGIFPNLSVRDNLRMGVAAHEMDEDEAIEQVLRDFPRLERLLERDGGALSGGEQQLLALARCLVSNPDLILARRADRRHPALDHRRDHRPAQAAQHAAWASQSCWWNRASISSLRCQIACC